MDELGLELRNQREALGLSLEDVYQRIRINPDLLEAMESGNFEVLPEAYARLFVRKYAQELGLDSVEILRRFEHGTGTPPPQRGLTQRSYGGQRSSGGPRASGGPSIASMIGAVFGVAVVIGAVWFLMHDVEEEGRALVPVELADRGRPADKGRPADRSPSRSSPPGIPAPGGDEAVPRPPEASKRETATEQADGEVAEATAPPPQEPAPEQSTPSQGDGIPPEGEPPVPPAAAASEPEVAESLPSDESPQPSPDGAPPSAPEAARVAPQEEPGGDEEASTEPLPSEEDAPPVSPPGEGDLSEQREGPRPAPTEVDEPSLDGKPDVEPSQSESEEGPVEGRGLLRERVVSAYSLSPGLSLQRRDTVLVLAAQAIQSTRMAVSADGQRVFDEVLKRESEHSWTARSRFYLEIAEAPAVVLSLQGHPIDPQCQPGRKLRLYVSRSSIWVEEVETSPALPPDTDR